MFCFWSVSTALGGVRTVGLTMTSSPLTTAFSVPLLLPIHVWEGEEEREKRRGIEREGEGGENELRGMKMSDMWYQRGPCKGRSKEGRQRRRQEGKMKRSFQSNFHVECSKKNEGKR